MLVMLQCMRTDAVRSALRHNAIALPAAKRIVTDDDDAIARLVAEAQAADNSDGNAKKPHDRNRTPGIPAGVEGKGIKPPSGLTTAKSDPQGCLQGSQGGQKPPSSLPAAKDDPRKNLTGSQRGLLTRPRLQQSNGRNAPTPSRRRAECTPSTGNLGCQC